MKRFLTILLLVAIVGMTGCRKKNIIPDDTLAEIFHDAFLVNAYIGEERINLDSLQIYEPIFEQYGYTAKDVVHTVGNFSRRKSARLGSVVEQAISRLEKESKEYSKKVVILDTIRNVAVRSFTRQVYKDTLITAKKLADSTRLEIEISPVLVGEYTINYNYKCDGNVAENPRKAEFYFEDARNMRNGYASVSLQQFGKVNRTLVSKKSGAKLVLNLGKLLPTSKVIADSKKKKSKKKGKKSTDSDIAEVSIRYLTVTYKPKEEEAVDSLFKRYVDIKIFADGFLIKKDSLALSPDTTRVSTPTPHND